MMKAFTPGAIRRMQPRVDSQVAHLLDDLAEATEFDLVSQVAEHVPAAIMCEMLDFPIERREWAAERVLGMSRTLDPDMSPEEGALLVAGLGEVEEFLLPIVRHRRSHPGDDLMSGLTQAEIDGELLTDTEIVANTILLFLAGHSTTRSLATNAVLELFRFPDQMKLLRENPNLDRAATEEFLRFVGTIQMVGKRALKDVSVLETFIPEGSEVFFVLASANRDSEVYSDPERLDLTRFATGTPPPSAAFGSGVHYCLGANLARMEVTAIVPTLIRRFPRLELPAQELWYRGFANRGPSALRLLTNGSTSQ
jgi:cytochrome P450